MGKVEFLFDKSKDALNIWDKINKPVPYNAFLRGLSPRLMEICKGKAFEDCKDEIIEYNQGIYDSGVIKIFLEALEKYWGKIENQFFERLEKITGKKYDEKTKCYVTTISICPYDSDEKSFMCSVLYNLPQAISTIAHELLHLHFHKYYYDEIEKELGEEKTHDLKESLTVLLNSEFKDLLIGYDSGYESHKELRDFILREWKKEKDFDGLLVKCVELLKEK